MKRFSEQDIRIFLKAMDRHLATPCEITIIGGAAIALAYRGADTTVDIDTDRHVEGLQAAYTAAKNETGLAIPFGPAGVFDGPYHYEDRLKELKSLRLKTMRIFVPEVHDLILMKTVRGNEHDIEHARGIQKSQRIDADILIERFRGEMKHVVGNRRTLELNFLAILAALFGEARAEKAENEI